MESRGFWEKTETLYTFIINIKHIPHAEGEKKPAYLSYFEEDKDNLFIISFPGKLFLLIIE